MLTSDDQVNSIPPQGEGGSPRSFADISHLPKFISLYIRWPELLYE